MSRVRLYIIVTLLRHSRTDVWLIYTVCAKTNYYRIFPINYIPRETCHIKLIRQDSFWAILLRKLDVRKQKLFLLKKKIRTIYLLRLNKSSLNGRTQSRCTSRDDHNVIPAVFNIISFQRSPSFSMWLAMLAELWMTTSGQVGYYIE